MPRFATGESVVERAVRVIEAFGTDDTTLSVAEIARRSGLPLPTASRLVSLLTGLGLLTRSENRHVALGLRLWELGARANPAMLLRGAAMPVMEDLHAVVGQHLQLGVLEGSDVLYVERLSAPGAVVNYARVAGRRPLYASSAGLVLLAHGSTALQEQVLQGPLRTYTPDSIATSERLRSTLSRIRRDGYTVTPGHVHPDVTGLAVPLRDPDGDVVAALALILPRAVDARAHVPALLSAARGIARRLPRAPGRGPRPPLIG